MDFVDRKATDIKNAVEYNYTDADINQVCFELKLIVLWNLILQIVKEKTRFSKNPTNYAFQKGELHKAKVCFGLCEYLSVILDVKHFNPKLNVKIGNEIT